MAKEVALEVKNLQLYPRILLRKKGLPRAERWSWQLSPSLPRMAQRAKGQLLQQMRLKILPRLHPKTTLLLNPST